MSPLRAKCVSPKQSAGIETLTGSAPFLRGQIHSPAFLSGGGTTCGSSPSSCERYIAEPISRCRQSPSVKPLSANSRLGRTYTSPSKYYDPNASHKHHHPLLHSHPAPSPPPPEGNNATTSPCYTESSRSCPLPRWLLMRPGMKLSCSKRGGWQDQPPFRLESRDGDVG